MPDRIELDEYGWKNTQRCCYLKWHKDYSTADLHLEGLIDDGSSTKSNAVKVSGAVVFNLDYDDQQKMLD